MSDSGRGGSARRYFSNADEFIGAKGDRGRKIQRLDGRAEGATPAVMRAVPGDGEHRIARERAHLRRGAAPLVAEHQAISCHESSGGVSLRGDRPAADIHQRDPRVASPQGLERDLGLERQTEDGAHAGADHLGVVGVHAVGRQQASEAAEPGE